MSYPLAIAAFSRFLFSLDYADFPSAIYCRDAIAALQSQEMLERPVALSEEELLGMDGTPVYCVDKKLYSGQWCLVDDGEIRDKEGVGLKIWLKLQDFDIYTRPPEGAG